MSVLTRITSVSQQLENSLNEFGEPWMLNPGDGAFYGPKVRHLFNCCVEVNQVHETLNHLI